MSDACGLVRFCVSTTCLLPQVSTSSSAPLDRHGEQIDSRQATRHFGCSTSCKGSLPTGVDWLDLNGSTAVEVEVGVYTATRASKLEACSHSLETLAFVFASQVRFLYCIVGAMSD